jgi:hypothetical protein
MKIPKFGTRKELIDFLVKHKETLIAQKKAEIKHADCVSFNSLIIDHKGDALKANVAVAGELSKLNVRVVINTTNLMDNHKDVHLPGLWKKSLKENKSIMHIQEHKMEFSKIIADGKELKSYTQDYTWNELGFNWEGKTEALVFDSTVTKRNPYMLEQYKGGYVKNHSVGMIYVKIILAVNDEEYGAEYEAWEKYYPQIVNKEVADKSGYFWAVKEAKIIEGSAVPIGSNYVTPTLENNLKENNGEEPAKATQEEPSDDTQKTEIGINKLFFT